MPQLAHSQKSTHLQNPTQPRRYEDLSNSRSVLQPSSQTDQDAWIPDRKIRSCTPDPAHQMEAGGGK